MQEPPAIYFHPDAVESEGKDLVGRRSAGQSFLAGFLQHVPGDHVNAVTETLQGSKAFEKAARALGETRSLKVDTLRGKSDFTRAGTIFFPAPGYQGAAWKRQRLGPQKCSLVGITHTVSTRRVVEGFHGLISQPVEDWDAIICTSRAVQSVVAAQFDAEARFFRQRFGATRVPLPQLPIIPLGIRSADFQFDPAARADLRERYGVGAEDIVLLTMGRWTVVEKANPAPLFLILEEITRELGRKVHLWMAGWAARPEETALHREGAAHLCPSVETKMLDGRDPYLRHGLWSAADVFTLPVDNIQETFGLVPVEAMSAGLPVVMPDWNGFRDTVLHGETGMLVPTHMARPGSGGVIGQRYADGTDDYVRHLLMVGQTVAIDLPAYKAALLALFRDPELRARMGKAGAAHVARNFDLSAVIPRYLELADELAARRGKASGPTTPALSAMSPNPIEIEPHSLYAGYPTHALLPESLVSAISGLTAERLALIDSYNGRAQYQRKVVDDAALLRCHAALIAAGTVTVDTLTRQTGMSPLAAEAALLFLAKHGFVVISPPGHN